MYVQALLPGITKTQFMQRSSDLAGFKMKLLDCIPQSPESVVAGSLKACKKRKGPVVIPGLHNKLLTMLIRILPRKLVVWTMGKISDLAR